MVGLANSSDASIDLLFQRITDRKWRTRQACDMDPEITDLFLRVGNGEPRRQVRSWCRCRRPDRQTPP